LATWSDFAPAETVTSGDWATIQSTQAQQHGLLIGYAAHHDSRGAAPHIEFSGLEHREIGTFFTMPYRSRWPYYNWLRYFRLNGVYPSSTWLSVYYSRYYYQWYYTYWRWTWYGRWHVQATIKMAVADEAGTIIMTAQGNDDFVAEKLKVFDTNISTDASRQVEQVSFQRSNLAANWQNPLRGSFDVLADDVVILFGVDFTANYFNNALTIGGSSPATQTLLDEFDTYPIYAGGVRARILRVKSNGTMDWGWLYAAAGAGAIRLTPNVEEGDVTPPSPTLPDQMHFEIQVVEDAFGNRSYKKEFIALVKQLKYRTDWGIFQAWKREDSNIVVDEAGNDVITGGKRVEIWSVPKSFEASVNAIPGAYILPSKTTLAGRILYHTERWG